MSPEEVMLSGSVSNGTTVCPGDKVTLTCATYGSRILTWFPYDREFTDVDVVGVSHSITMNISATLDSVDRTPDGNVTMVSTLCIVASEPATYSVTCHSSWHHIDKTFTFNVRPEGKYCTC